MDELKFRALLRAGLQDTTAYIGGDISIERADALDAYLQKPLGNEVEGQSQVRTAVVHDTVEWALPSFLRAFTTSERAVQYKPKGPKDEQFAQQATDYANLVFYEDNDGFTILYTWIKDALLQKNGFTKTWGDKQPSVKRYRLEGLTLDQVNTLTNPDDLEEDEEVTIAQSREYQRPMTPEATQAPMLGAGIGGMEVVYDIVLEHKRKEWRITIENVPPEEILITRWARSLNDATMIAHRTMKTIQDWESEFGFDRDKLKQVTSSGAASTQEYSRRRQNFDTYNMGGSVGAVDDLREVWLNHVFIKIDYDGDKTPEWRAVWCDDAVAEVFENEEVDEHPFDTLTACPMPHQLFGRSIYDQAGDIDEIDTTLHRQLLDNIYRVNNARTFISSKVNLDDYLANRPGGAVQVESDGELPLQHHAMPIPTIPIGDFIYPAIERVAVMAEQRTGIMRLNQGLEPDALKSNDVGSMGLMKMMAQSMGRQELATRNMAQTGVRSLFKRLLRLMVKHQDKARMVRLRNEWVEVDPSVWNAEMDVSVNVGLGFDNKDSEAMAHTQFLQVIQQLVTLQGGVDGPLTSWEGVHKEIVELGQSLGIRGIDQVIRDPKSPEAQQAIQAMMQRPSPQQMEIEATKEIEAAKLQAKAAEAQQKAQLDREKAERDAALERWKAEQEFALKRMELEFELEIKRQSAQADIEIKRSTAAAQAQIAARKAAQQPSRPQ